MGIDIFPKSGLNAGDTQRVEDLENTVVKVSYYAEISTTTGQITIPTGATVLLNQWADGVDALYSPISGGKPTFVTTGTTVATFDATGNYTLSGALITTPSALVYYFTMQFKDLGNLNPEFIVEFADLKVDPAGAVSWVYPYVDGTYSAGTMTRVGDWTTISNTTTSDYPVPEYVGEEFNLYAGTIGTAIATARQLIFGTRYTATTSAYIKAYRLYTVAGNKYQLYTVIDPLGAKIFKQSLAFTADTSGWVDISITPTLVLNTQVIDFVALVQEPDPTPTTFNGTWTYQKPNSETTPLTGEISHATKALNKLKIHYTDSLAGDRTVELQSLNVGDLIRVDDIEWSIQGTTDQITYIDIDVAPATQSLNTGATVFTFETKVETPITYAVDTGYYTGNPNAAGLFVEDAGYGSIVVNANAYGMDLLVQQVTQSSDWDIVASSANIGTATDAKLTDFLNQIEVVSTGDDQGVQFLNQVEVAGELIAGADSYPVPIAFHCTVANTTGKTITSAVDITSILQSDSGSATGLFNGITAGNYILVGAPETYEGVKVKYTSLATVEPDNITGEYYRNDTTTWVNAPFMGTNSDFPYEATGDQIATAGHTSEQIFFGFDPLTRDQPSGWETHTFNINGQNHTYKWARLRVTSAITGDPQIEQVKLHADRIEMEATGFFKYGRARTPLQLFAGINEVVRSATNDPANESVAYMPNFTAAYEDNEFANNSVDGVGVVVNRKFGLDTSVALTVAISFYVKGTATGDVNLGFETSQVNDGYVYDGTEPYDSTSLTTTIAVPSNLVRQTVQTTVPINKLQANSGIVVHVFRDATAVNTADTLAANIVLTNVVVTGFQWKH